MPLVKGTNVDSSLKCQNSELGPQKANYAYGAIALCDIVRVKREREREREGVQWGRVATGVSLTGATICGMCVFAFEQTYLCESICQDKH